MAAPSATPSTTVPFLDTFGFLPKALLEPSKALS